MPSKDAFHERKIRPIILLIFVLLYNFRIFLGVGSGLVDTACLALVFINPLTLCSRIGNAMGNCYRPRRASTEDGLESVRRIRTG